MAALDEIVTGVLVSSVDENGDGSVLHEYVGFVPFADGIFARRVGLGHNGEARSGLSGYADKFQEVTEKLRAAIRKFISTIPILLRT